MELITLKTFHNPIDAHLFKTRLESEGILCFLFDENMVSLNPFYNYMMGGIKLKINKLDLERVEEILRDTEMG
jgi:hypothetical protein